MKHWPECIPPDEVGAPGVCVCDGKPKPTNVLDAFKPLPANEVELMREYGDASLYPNDDE